MIPRNLRRLNGLLRVGLIIVVAGCSSPLPNDPTDGFFTFEFPDTGDVLVIVHSQGGGKLSIYGSRLDGGISQIEVDDPETSFIVVFDAAGRPTMASLNGMVIDLTHHADGTFDYRLTKDGALLSQGEKLKPAKDVPDFLSDSKAEIRSQNTPKGVMSALDLLLCAGTMLEYVAGKECAKAGYPDSPTDSLLAVTLKESPEDIDAAIFMCGSEASNLRLHNAHAVCLADTSEPNCAALNGASNAARDLRNITLAMLQHRAAIAHTLILTTDTSADACAPPTTDPADPMDPTDPPDPTDPTDPTDPEDPQDPNPANLISMWGDVRIITSATKANGWNSQLHAGAAVIAYDYATHEILATTISSDEDLNGWGHNYELRVPNQRYIYIEVLEEGHAGSGCCIFVDGYFSVFNKCNPLLRPVQPLCNMDINKFRLSQGTAWPVWGAGDSNLDGVLPESCDGTSYVNALSPALSAICISGSKTAPTFDLRDDVPDVPAGAFINQIYLAGSELGALFHVKNAAGITPPFVYGDTSIAAHPPETNVLADGSTPLQPGRTYWLQLVWSDTSMAPWELTFEVRP